MRLLALALVVSACCSSSPPVDSTTRSLSTCTTIRRPGAAFETVFDVSIQPGWPDPFGGNLRTGGTSASTESRTLLSFDLSSIPPGAVVTSATVELWSGSTSGPGVRIHRATAAWTEASANWASANAFDPAVLATLSTGSNWRTASVVPQIQSWVSGAPNYGFLLEQDLVGTTTFRSSNNSNILNRPTLQVCYTTGSAPPDAAAPSPPDAPPSTANATAAADVAASPDAPPLPSGTYQVAVIGDFGALGPGRTAVGNLVNGWVPAWILTTGDNAYDSSADPYPTTVGALYAAHVSTGTFLPSMGNHDWCSDSQCLNSAHDPSYRAYFTLPAGPGNERYYTQALDAQNTVRVYALDSDDREPHGVSSGSQQGQWLQAQLASSTACFDIVYFHEMARSSCRGHCPKPAMNWPFLEWGADAVFQGHIHAYERLEYQRAVGDIVPYFVNGTGGGGLHLSPDTCPNPANCWTNIPPESVFRQSPPGAYGAQRITVSRAAGSATLLIEYITTDGVVRDSASYTRACQ